MNATKRVQLQLSCKRDDAMWASGGGGQGGGNLQLEGYNEKNPCLSLPTGEPQSLGGDGGRRPLRRHSEVDHRSHAAIWGRKLAAEGAKPDVKL